MGYYYGTYVAYGVRVDHLSDLSSGELADHLDEHLDGTGCGQLMAGNYDQEMLFLVIAEDGLDVSEVKLGAFRSFNPERLSVPEYARWDRNLTQVLAVIGITPDADPAWLVVPDLS